MAILNNEILMHRITTLQSIRNSKGEKIGFKAECNHRGGENRKIYTLSEWGDIAYDLAIDWALNHKCSGDISAVHLNAAEKEIADYNPNANQIAEYVGGSLKVR